MAKKSAVEKNNRRTPAGPAGYDPRPVPADGRTVCGRAETFRRAARQRPDTDP